jgi:hypothetical protein
MPATCGKWQKSTSREQVASWRMRPFKNIKEADLRFAKCLRGS